MDMTLSFYYYYLFLNELFKKNEQKKFDKKKKQAKQTSNMTAVTSRANQQFAILKRFIWKRLNSLKWLKTYLHHQLTYPLLPSLPCILNSLSRQI